MDDTAATKPVEVLDDVDLFRLQKLQLDVENARLKVEIAMKDAQIKYTLSTSDRVELSTGRIIRGAGA